MTKLEFIAKREQFKRSDAPVQVKIEAIAKLETEYYGLPPQKKQLILASISEASADVSDIAGGGRPNDN